MLRHTLRLMLLRYFTLFMNLLNDCSEVEDDGQPVVGRKRGMSRRLASLRHCTVLAMSNLLNANVDSGLMHSIGQCFSNWGVCMCSPRVMQRYCRPVQGGA